MAIVEDRQTGQAKILRNKKVGEANIAALELRAIIAALSWIWDKGLYTPGTKISVYSDCQSAIHTIQNKGKYSFSQFLRRKKRGIDKKSSVSSERGAIQILVNKMHVQGFHVKAHSGHLMNELVDTLAGAMTGSHVKESPEQFKSFTLWQRIKLFLGMKMGVYK